ncbi:hypothetical protein CBR_g3166 [Chara braunii]|uniref:Integrase catalytic domain-containing protein n=1 Tax=Chara braunii TaxID=69332 RepID=A0A388KEY0_CHABU|nr:hypothetical protein CBR_g3166 [Chara braunii]|eukprot:GBG68625.1 hypothetical protein CBR_g3166 [Chara braunii]
MSGSDPVDDRADNRRLTRARALRVPHVFQALEPGEERRIRRARALAAGIAEANRAAKEQATTCRAAAMANGASSAASSSTSSSGNSGMSVGMPTSSTSSSCTPVSTGSSQSSSQMAGSQFSPLTPRQRELKEIEQVEMLRRKLEKDLKDATDRENAMKTRAARLESLENDKAELEGLDGSTLTDPLKVLKKNMLSLHAHVESKLDFMQSTLDQILDALTRLGFRPPAQSPLPLSAMSGPFPVQAGTQPSGLSVSMDFMDTLVTSKSGKRHIFVIIDRFTKYARLIPMPETARTEYVIKLFKDNWVRDFGLPKTIISDRDVRFTSELWKKTAEQMGSQLQMTSGNHPEANRQTEQMNRVVQHLLRHYIKPSQDDWDEQLPLIASLYNNVIHSSIGVSPNQLHLGWKPRSALDFLLPENRPAATPGTLEYGVQYEKLLQDVVEHMKKAQQAMIASENQHRRQSTFQVGERVWVKASELGQEFGISRKLMPQYFGPWEVLDVVGDESDGPTYVIRVPGHLRTHQVFHASKLAPFAETDQFPSRRSMLPPTMDGQVDIDDIVDHRDMPVPKPLGRGRPPKPKREYQIRFRHHTDPKEDRWFTLEELMETAPQVVADYERKLKGKAPAK